MAVGIEALILGIGFWGILWSSYRKEPLVSLLIMLVSVLQTRTGQRKLSDRRGFQGLGLLDVRAESAEGRTRIQYSRRVLPSFVCCGPPTPVRQEGSGNPTGGGPGK